MDKTNLSEAYGRALYHVRAERKISRQDVVNHNDISLNALSDIENGKALIKLSTLEMLLAYYRTNMPDFVNRYFTSEENNHTLFDQIEDDARFFVLDTRGAVDKNKYADQDFKYYQWNAHVFNKVREGDWFIYRRPQEGNRQFRLFGAGQIGTIDRQSDGTCTATLKNTFAFNHYLIGDEDLVDYKWSFKERTRPNWLYFFNQYGMTMIDQTDFVNLVTMGMKNAAHELNVDLVAEESALYRSIRSGDYKVTDTVSPTKQRLGQQMIAEIIKDNYGYQCAVTRIHTRPFLIASHIIPWSANESTRLDPSNIICLSPMWDKAFDQGFITLDPGTLVIRESNLVHQDKALEAVIQPYVGHRIQLPRASQPSKIALEYHNDVIFKK